MCRAVHALPNERPHERNCQLFTCCVAVQGSPTDSNSERETYRHALAATATRTGTDGVIYLYTLNLACPERMWSDMQPQFQKSIDSFRLVEPASVRPLGANAQCHVQIAAI